MRRRNTENGARERVKESPEEREKEEWEQKERGGERKGSERGRRREREGESLVPFGRVSAWVVIKSPSFFQKPVIQEGTLMRFSCSSRAAHNPLEHVSDYP